MKRLYWASLVTQLVKSLPAMQETQVRSLGQEYPLRKGMATTPVFLPGEFHGKKSLACYSPWGGKELDTAESDMVRLHRESDTMRLYNVLCLSFHTNKSSGLNLTTTDKK